MTLEERFWDKVLLAFDAHSCWEWKAARDPQTGYGKIGFGGKTYGAHRVSYQLNVGEIPDGMYVLHTCDNRACVRPDHLYTGTQRDNIHDMLRKGRGRGQFTEGPAHLVSDGHAMAMAEMYDQVPEMTQEDLGVWFGIPTATVNRALNRRRTNE